MIRLLVFLLLTTSSLSAQSIIWSRHVIDSFYSGADGVRLADVNNDKLMDIATGKH